MAEAGNGVPRYVTSGELADKLDLVRQEQKTEHWKTRVLVAILALPNIGRAVPYLLGAFGVHVPTW
jgi:hypothetical protein